MKKDEIRSLAYELLETVPGNILTEDMDIDPRFSGIRLFDAPLVGFGSASVSLFAEYKKPGIIGPWHMSPEEWLPGAKSVISIQNSPFVFSLLSVATTCPLSSTVYLQA